jgi:hypothetical protein
VYPPPRAIVSWRTLRIFSRPSQCNSAQRKAHSRVRNKCSSFKRAQLCTSTQKQRQRLFQTRFRFGGSRVLNPTQLTRQTNVIRTVIRYRISIRNRPIECLKNITTPEQHQLVTPPSPLSSQTYIITPSPATSSILYCERLTLHLRSIRCAILRRSISRRRTMASLDMSRRAVTRQVHRKQDQRDGKQNTTHVSLTRTHSTQHTYKSTIDSANAV